MRCQVQSYRWKAGWWWGGGGRDRDCPPLREPQGPLPCVEPPGKTPSSRGPPARPEARRCVREGQREMAVTESPQERAGPAALGTGAAAALSVPPSASLSRPPLPGSRVAPRLRAGWQGPGLAKSRQPGVPSQPAGPFEGTCPKTTPLQ